MKENLKDWEVKCYLPFGEESFAFDVRDLEQWIINGNEYEQYKRDRNLREYFPQRIKI